MWTLCTIVAQSWVSYHYVSLFGGLRSFWCTFPTLSEHCTLISIYYTIYYIIRVVYQSFDCTSPASFVYRSAVPLVSRPSQHRHSGAKNPPKKPLAKALAPLTPSQNWAHSAVINTLFLVASVTAQLPLPASVHPGTDATCCARSEAPPGVVFCSKQECSECWLRATTTNAARSIGTMARFSSQGYNIILASADTKIWITVGFQWLQRS